MQLVGQHLTESKNNYLNFAETRASSRPRRRPCCMLRYTSRSIIRPAPLRLLPASHARSTHQVVSLGS